MTKAGEREQHEHKLSWTDTFVGVVMTLGLMLLFTLLAGSLGLWSYDLIEGPEQKSKFWLCAFLGWVISSYFGGYIAAYSSTSRRSAAGILQGLIVWMSASLLLTVLLGVLSGSFFHGYLLPIESTGASWMFLWASLFAGLFAIIGGRRGAALNSYEFIVEPLSPEEHSVYVQS